MNLKKAYSILKLNEETLNEAELKTSYYKMALKYHPDKNGDKNSNEKFIEIKEAYDYLTNHLINKNEKTTTFKDAELKNFDYYSLLTTMLSSLIGKDISFDVLNNIVKQLKEGVNSAVSKELDKYDKTVLLKLYDILIEYMEVIGIECNYGSILQLLREKITKNKKVNYNENENDYLSDSIYITLNPSINNLLNADIYKLEYEDDILCVPLWHDEIIFECNNKKIVVKCIPELQDNIFLGSDNSLHANIILNINDLFNKGNKLDTKIHKVNIGEKVFEINIYDLKLRPFQTICLHKKGVPVIDNINFYSTYKKNNIYIHIQLQNK
jgi:hypothetical protein